jgi:hypothetical protein
MAMWNSHLCVQHQLFAEAIFNAKYMECSAQFWWIPYLDKWEAYFKTKFKYLSIDEKVDFERDFLKTYDSFVSVIENVRNQVLKEYNNYFNELWC